MRKNCFEKIKDFECNSKPNIPYTINYIGVIGPTGATGPIRPTGTSGILGFADFYALWITKKQSLHLTLLFK